MKKKTNKIKCYNKIKIMVLNKILLVSKTSAKNACFNIPLFLIGETSYNIDDCSTFLKKKLKKRGFKSLLIKPNFLYIY